MKLLTTQFTSMNSLVRQDARKKILYSYFNMFNIQISTYRISVLKVILPEKL